VAQAKGMPRTKLRREYHEGFMSVLAIPATRGRHANVLQHMAARCFDLEDLSGAV